MSEDSEMHSSDEVVVAKKERKEKKDKKEKKEKKRSKSVSNVEASEPDTDEDAETPAKKRKRDALPEEIEINVDLPEPVSKKAARLAKKAKLNPAPATTDGAGASTDAKPAAEAADPNKRSEFGVWIGNLPWSATKESLRSFLVGNTEITSEQITRVHLPPPNKPVNPSWTTKPLNRGFAYVDFSTELAMYSAIALTETKMDGRALLIKNAKSFEGRPDKPKTEVEESGGRGKGPVKTAHPPNKRVFIGNLSFDVTKEDLQTHYTQVGELEHIHMATFEDSGKCKGYAWVTFGDVEAATAAVQGFVYKTEAELAKNKKARDGSDDEGDAKKSNKKRKWFLNKFMGRELRCEFAEDATTRYNKRYGKEKEPEAVEGVNPARWQNFSKDGGDRRGGKKEWKPREPREPREKVDPRTIKSGAAHTNAQRASHAIVESQGKKTTFE